MMDLGYFKEKNTSDFLERFVNLWNNDYHEAKKISLASGRYFHHIESNVFEVSENANDEFIKRAIDVTQVRFLLEIVNPIEKVKAGCRDKCIISSW